METRLIWRFSFHSVENSSPPTISKILDVVEVHMEELNFDFQFLWIMDWQNHPPKLSDYESAHCDARAPVRVARKEHVPLSMVKPRSRIVPGFRDQVLGSQDTSPALLSSVPIRIGSMTIVKVWRRKPRTSTLNHLIFSHAVLRTGLPGKLQSDCARGSKDCLVLFCPFSIVL